MKIIALEESADFATLDTEKLFMKLKSHELSRKSHPSHDASLSSKALITSAHVGGHDANPTNTTVSFALEFVLSSLAVAFDEQYESIPNDTTHFIADCPKRKNLDSSNKYDYTKRNDYSKDDDKKKYRFRDEKKKKKF
jgi:hypothetical protein